MPAAGAVNARVLGAARLADANGRMFRLWREWNATRDVTALRLLTEYNLYDAINLRSVLEWTSWRVAERHAWAVTRQPIFERGEVLYDVSRLLLAL